MSPRRVAARAESRLFHVTVSEGWGGLEMYDETERKREGGGRERVGWGGGGRRGRKEIKSNGTHGMRLRTSQKQILNQYS